MNARSPLAAVAEGAAPEGSISRDLVRRGLIAAPGLIDIHTHSDMSLMLDGRAQSKVSQGGTSSASLDQQFTVAKAALAASD